MKGKLLLLSCLCFFRLAAQNDSTTVDVSKEMEAKKSLTPEEEKPALKVFYGQRLINANTVEVLRKGVMEFRVIHNFSDIAGTDGGIRHFFGLDDAFDVKIGFQIGLTDHLNILLARSRGASAVSQIWELGLKQQFMHQELHDPSHPFSFTVFANITASAVHANHNTFSETNFNGFGDRLSECVQLMIAKKIGSISLQLNPTFVNRHYVIPGDDKGIFAIGAGVRVPLSKKLVLIADYFHSFRSQQSKDVYASLSPSVKFYDPLGVGFEILTQGHVFHVNFTNSTDILENKFITRTTKSWGKGQFRWGFTISRNFILFRDKKKK
jgi:hypothetical protein